MPQAEPKQKPKGLHCPNCGGVRLTVVSSARPCVGVKVRYRKCAACGGNVTTREVVVQPGKRKPRANPGAV